jgi:hypothetical protein
MLQLYSRIPINPLNPRPRPFFAPSMSTTLPPAGRSQPNATCRTSRSTPESHAGVPFHTRSPSVRSPMGVPQRSCARPRMELNHRPPPAEGVPPGCLPFTYTSRAVPKILLSAGCDDNPYSPTPTPRRIEVGLHGETSAHGTQSRGCRGWGVPPERASDVAMRAPWVATPSLSRRGADPLPTVTLQLP